MAGRPEGYVEVVARRGENLKAIFDELGDLVRGNRAAERLVALGHLELNDGAAELGYAHTYDWDAPVRDAHTKKTPTRRVAGAVA